jgi:potassium efflux system protein
MTSRCHFQVAFRRAARHAAVVIALAGVVSGARAQLPAAPAPAAAPSAESAAGTAPAAAVVVSEGAAQATQLEAARRQLEAAQGDTELGEESKAKLVELLQQAVGAEERAEALRAQAAALRQEMEQAPARIEQLRTELAAPRPAPEVEVPDGEPAARYAEGQLRKVETELLAARQRVQALTDGLAKQRQRPDELKASIPDTRQRMTELAAQLKAPAVADEPTSLVEGRRTALESRQRYRAEELAFAELELGSHDQKLTLITAELELAKVQANALAAVVEAWQARLQGEREREVAATAREAAATERAVAALPAEVRQLAERNTELAGQLKELTAREASVTERLTATDARLAVVEEDLAQVRQRVDLAGLNETVALVLRKLRDGLPTMGDYRRLARELRSSTSDAVGRQLDVEDARRRLSDPAKLAQTILDSAEPPLADALKAERLPEVETIVRQQRELVNKLYDGYARYIKQLGRLENAQLALVARAQALNRLIDENLLWIRSSGAVSGATFTDAARGVGWLLAPTSWVGVVRDVGASLAAMPVWWALGLALIAGSFALRGRLERDLERIASRVGKVRTDSFLLTLRALLATALMSLRWPVVAAVVGWPLLVRTEAEPFSRAVGAGLIAVALIALGFTVLDKLNVRNGLGEAHFRWPVPARRALRNDLRWLAMIALPAGFAIWTVESQEDVLLRASLGRLTFIVAMAALAVFLASVLRPSGPLMDALRERSTTGMVIKLRHLLLGAAVLLPLALAVLSIFGYHYSAIQLQNRLQATAWLVIGVVIASECLMRWLYVAHRRLAYEEARRERLQARQERAAGKAPAAAEDGEPIELEEPKVGLEEVHKQTGSLIRSVVGFSAIIGLWMIWAEVLPALNVLDSVALWHYPTRVEGVEQLVPVTLFGVAVAVLIAGITYLAAKNLPGALEITLLNHTGLDSGAKYAITKLLSYVILGTGVLMVFGHLGVAWSRLQWLVAALSVGLGFGLQEIVANFISGIILLFERPIRVGDIVTVNNMSGTVTRIRIRATTITDWDRKELIVPNKRFITGEILNWTLSNELNRIFISIGVAYGSDTDRARDLMLKVAEEHPKILADPGPMASFEGFGDNALTLNLRCYLPSMDGRLGVITELHSAIDAEFKKAGIEISFPQRDVHLDAARPFEVRIARDDARGPPWRARRDRPGG